jgi:hypothetical protein
MVALEKDISYRYPLAPMVGPEVCSLKQPAKPAAINIAAQYDRAPIAFLLLDEIAIRIMTDEEAVQHLRAEIAERDKIARLTAPSPSMAMPQMSPPVCQAQTKRLSGGVRCDRPVLGRLAVRAISNCLRDVTLL